MDTAEADPIPAPQQHILARVGLPFRFTPETARAMSAKAAEARARRKAETVAAAAITAPAPIIPEPTPQPIATPPQPIQAPDSYVGERIARVREQIRTLSARIDDELAGDCDAKRVRELSDALSKLCDLERTWDCRPLPGSLRPVAVTKRSRGAELLSE